MGSTLNEAIKVTRVSNAVPVGTAPINCTAIDMTGFDGVLFIAQFGAITDGTPGIKGQEDTSFGMASAADIAGSSVTLALSASNKAVILDVRKPVKGFLRCVVTRGGVTGAVIDSVIAIQYGASMQPTVHDPATVANAEDFGSPPEGTP